MLTASGVGQITAFQYVQLFRSSGASNHMQFQTGLLRHMGWLRTATLGLGAGRIHIPESWHRKTRVHPCAQDGTTFRAASSWEAQVDASSSALRRSKNTLQSRLSHATLPAAVPPQGGRPPPPSQCRQTCGDALQRDRPAVARTSETSSV